MQYLLLRLKSHSAREISRDFCRNKHDTFLHVLSTGYFYILFLWAIAVSNFRPMEIYENLGLPLSTIKFKVISHVDNQFYKHIHLFQILYNMKSVLFKIHVKVFIFKFVLNVEYRSFFQLKSMTHRKKTKLFFSVDYVKTIELHVVHTWRHMQSE